MDRQQALDRARKIMQQHVETVKGYERVTGGIGRRSDYEAATAEETIEEIATAMQQVLHEELRKQGAESPNPNPWWKTRL